jgi:NAD(P)-dependent dehydrogenase (short-subunit alcohol dehydrogenase family)
VDPLDPFAPFRLDGKVVLVTGASSGFGTRFARVAAAAGGRVALAARRRERLDALAAELPDALAVECDLAVDDDRRRLVDAVVGHYGRVDVLVNNAGISDAPDAAEDADVDRFRAVVELNLNACFHLAALCARHMIDAGGGSIVNVGSVHSLNGSAPNRQAAYVASKHAVLGLTRELALQWARQGVRVNTLGPGYFHTELTDVMFNDDRMTGWIERNTPMRRGGTEHELDGAFLFLASDASSYVTGTSLMVDGGWTAR